MALRTNRKCRGISKCIWNEVAKVWIGSIKTYPTLGLLLQLFVGVHCCCGIKGHLSLGVYAHICVCMRLQHSCICATRSTSTALMCQVPAMRVSERLEAAGFVRSDWSWESDLPNQALQPHGAGNALRGTEMGSKRTLTLL
jgi:hypothetical protein